MARWYAPLDPECPKVSSFMNSLFNDPITKAYGAPVGDIIEGYERQHRKTCKLCQAYGAANIEAQY